MFLTKPREFAVRQKKKRDEPEL